MTDRNGVALDICLCLALAVMSCFAVWQLHKLTQTKADIRKSRKVTKQLEDLLK